MIPLSLTKETANYILAVAREQLTEKKKRDLEESIQDLGANYDDGTGICLLVTRVSGDIRSDNTIGTTSPDS